MGNFSNQKNGEEEEWNLATRYRPPATAPDTVAVAYAEPSTPSPGSWLLRYDDSGRHYRFNEPTPDNIYHLDRRVPCDNPAMDHHHHDYHHHHKNACQRGTPVPHPYNKCCSSKCSNTNTCTSSSSSDNNNCSNNNCNHRHHMMMQSPQTCSSSDGGGGAMAGGGCPNNRLHGAHISTTCKGGGTSTAAGCYGGTFAGSYCCGGGNTCPRQGTCAAGCPPQEVACSRVLVGGEGIVCDTWKWREGYDDCKRLKFWWNRDTGERTFEDPYD